MLWLLWLFGCGGDTLPEEGIWLYAADSVSFTEDGCGLTSGLVFADLIIDQVTADGFRYIDTNGDAFSCTSDSADFSCATLSEDVDVSGSTSTLTFTSSQSGSFSDPSTLSRTLTIQGTCDGSDCDGLFGSVSFPCTTAASMDASYDGPAGALDTAFEG